MLATGDVEIYNGLMEVAVAPSILELTYNQQERLAALRRTRLFSKVSELLSTRYENGFIIYGGMAQFVSTDAPIPMDDFGRPVSAEMMTKGSFIDPKFDFENNADVDLMVADIGDVDSLITVIREQLGDGYEVIGSNVTDYPRIDIMQNGVEVMSISDLKTSVGMVKEINAKLGVENEGTDLEIYMKAKLVKNDMDPILIDSSGAKIIMFSGREKPVNLIEINDGSIYRPEVAQVLFELGDEDSAKIVMREWAYNVGKVAVMTQFGMVMAPEEQKKWRREVVENADWAGESPDVMKTLSRRLVKAANGNFGWFKMAAINFGFLSWYSKGLDQTLLDTYFTPDKWRKLIEVTNEMDDEMANGIAHLVEDFVGVVIADKLDDQKKKIKDEFTTRWNPGPMNRVAFAGGRKIKTV